MNFPFLIETDFPFVIETKKPLFNSTVFITNYENPDNISLKYESRIMFLLLTEYVKKDTYWITEHML